MWRLGPQLKQIPGVPFMERPPTVERIIICLLSRQVPIWQGLNAVSLERKKKNTHQKRQASGPPLTDSLSYLGGGNAEMGVGEEKGRGEKNPGTVSSLSYSSTFSSAQTGRAALPAGS